MTEEEKKAIADAAAKEAADKAAEAEKANAEFEASLEGLSEEEKAQKLAEKTAGKKDETDYEALFKEEEERRKKAEQALADKDFKEREARRKKEEDQDQDEDNKDKPLTETRLTEILRQERQATQKDLQEVRAIEIARANTSSEQEAQAAVLFWKNRVVPTGDLSADVLFAIGGLNHKKVVATNAELRKALQSRDNSNKDITGDHREPPAGSEPKLSTADATAYKQAGFTWDAVKRVYKKPLGNGKTFLYKDPKSKRQWVAA